ncbi:MAG: hypothetical protein KF745_07040 [Phycisphaeraceae bacterium]|nr:hypothetical protein [Phycisphaeraceae bacterium]
MKRAACAVVLACSSLCVADVLHDTDAPGGALGFWGPDVFDAQSVAARFAPSGSYTLDRVGVYFMNNDFGGGHPSVTLTLQTDASDEFGGGVSVPSGTVLETWQINVAAVGWQPVQQFVNSSSHPLLRSGRKYWVVAESSAEAQENGVWNFAATGSGYTATTDFGEWSGGASAALCLRVEGTGACPADFDGNGEVEPTDIAVFIQAWLASVAGGTLEGDFDGSGTVDPVDIAAFIQAWLQAVQGGC